MIFGCNPSSASLHKEWSAARALSNLHHEHHHQIMLSSWSKPAPGYIKINIDAASFKDINKYDVSVCIRDDQSNFISAKSLHYEGTPEPREAEAIDLLHGLLWAKRATTS